MFASANQRDRAKRSRIRNVATRRRSTLVSGSRNVRRVGRVLFVSVFAVSGLVATAPLAFACPALDPGCVVEDTTTTTGGVLEDTTTTGGGVLEDTTTTGGGVLEDTSTTAGGVLEDTTTTVGGALPGDGSLPGGVIPGGGGTVPGGGNESQPGGGETTPGGGGGNQGGGGGTTSGGGTQSEPTSSTTQGEPTGVLSASGSVGSTPTGDASTTVGRPFPSFLDEGSGALFSGSRLVKTLAFPFMLILLVVAFVFMQNRIDRRDPRLALAPVGSEYLPFT
jgi:hypothetical protein